jgi:hypothetical protein
VAARLAFNVLFLGVATRLAQRHGADQAHRDGRKLLEEMWVLIGNTAVLLASMMIVLYRNSGCTMVSLRPCLEGWPNHPLDGATILYYDFEIAWYVSLLLKPVLRYGLQDGRDMAAHHMASLALLLASRGLHLTRFGIVVLALFGMSNPALHLAKIANQLNASSRVRIGAFAAFAMVFFVTRVLMVPFIVLGPAAKYSRDWIPYAVEDFPGYYAGLNVLLAVLYVLQWVWMGAILRVLRKALDDGADAASKLSARVDPAKRYHVHHHGTNGKKE